MHGDRPCPCEALPRFADAFGLTGAARRGFLLEGVLSRVPDGLAAELRDADAAESMAALHAWGEDAAGQARLQHLRRIEAQLNALATGLGNVAGEIHAELSR